LNEWITRRSDEEAPAGQSTPQESARGFNSTSVDSQYQRDRARIIHSASFRALQSKTQVLGLGESDFYRTRLTHSLEVAQIGSGICEWLRNKPHDPPGQELQQWIPSLSLIEAICLAHDIGHSPFGHGGEVAPIAGAKMGCWDSVTGRRDSVSPSLSMERCFFIWPASSDLPNTRFSSIPV